MKAEIHPRYDEVTVRCSCGPEYSTRSTLCSGIKFDFIASGSRVRDDRVRDDRLRDEPVRDAENGRSHLSVAKADCRSDRRPVRRFIGRSARIRKLLQHGVVEVGASRDGLLSPCARRMIRVDFACRSRR